MTLEVDTIISLLDKFSNVFANLGEHDAGETEYIEHEIYQFMHSPKRESMMTGERYYVGNHDILRRKREMIGEDGKLEPVENLPNNRVVNNQYAKLVDQKANYLLGNPLSIQTDNEAYADLLNETLGPAFHRTLKNIGEDALNCGIGWLLVHYDENGALQLKRIRPYELIPGWKDAEHTILDFAIRIYPVIECEGINEDVGWRVEVFDKTGITYYEYDGALKPCEPYHENYITQITGDSEIGFNWDNIPLIAFKYNSKELPLIKKCKVLQDGLNVMMSDFENNMQEDARNTILVLTNYDGENLGEFRRNLATFGAVKVRNTGETRGGVNTLQIEVNAANYNLVLALLKQALIENAMGYDAKDDRLAGNPNQMNIQSMYSDIDLDANGMEMEFQAALSQLVWFLSAHFANTGQGDFEDEKVDFTFNRDVLINESELIANLRASEGMISRETRVAKHPYVADPRAELERMQQEEQEAMQQMLDYQELGVGGEPNADEE